MYQKYVKFKGLEVGIWISCSPNTPDKAVIDKARKQLKYIAQNAECSVGA
jgi:hypothetical protein